MLIELSYVFLGVLLVIYGVWLFLKRKQKVTVYLAVCFAFLTLSILFQTFASTWWIYVMHLKIQHRFIELTGLAFFACFAITAILALTKLSKPMAETTR